MVSASMDMNKDFLLNESKTFCMLPWTHLHVTPIGTAAPCCIADSCNNHVGMGDAKKERLLDLINSPKMKQLRLDMINGVPNTECNSCYSHEAHKIKSWRQTSNEAYEQYFDEVLNTNSDGSLPEFKMRYYDMRFSNICNFKCRTCSQEYSSQWEQENLRNNVSYALTFPKNTNTELVQDVLDNIEHMDTAYFAGGEPLIMDQHYVILEEMIRKGRTDIQLRYNTNASNLKYKNKDIIDLWSRFTKPIDIAVSIDHVKERAEYIRHGTDWGTVEKNVKLIRSLPNVAFSVNTVLSVFNFLTFDQFYQYLMVKEIYNSSCGIYNMTSPYHLSCHVLPPEYKQLGKQSLEQTIRVIGNNITDHARNHILEAITWAMSRDIADEIDPSNTTYMQLFKDEINRIDSIRGEDFRKTFPELAPLLDS